MQNHKQMHTSPEKIAIIGAGAAGCFAAIEIKRRKPDAEVVIYEAAPKPLIKLALTGGGRCNLTNSFREVGALTEVYPRGARLLQRAFRNFDHEDAMAWFEGEGVRLVIQEDQCVFPASQDAMQIVRMLLRRIDQLGIKLLCDRKLSKIAPDLQSGYVLEFAGTQREFADKVLVAIGGCSSDRLRSLLPEDIELAQSMPSLFTFKIGDMRLRSLMGTVVQDATLSLAGTKLRARGTLLLTDWGVSGPVTLRLSSYAAEHLFRQQYRSTLIINWLSCSEDEARRLLRSLAQAHAKKQLSNIRPEGIADRLWRYLLSRAGLREEQRWAELGGKPLNKLVSVLISDQYSIEGRAHFKEEFVTCGGVALSEVQLNTLESRKHPGLYFAGEVLDVDGVTGGFNLQAAWSTAKAVSMSI